MLAPDGFAVPPGHQVPARGRKGLYGPPVTAFHPYCGRNCRRGRGHAPSTATPPPPEVIADYSAYGSKVFIRLGNHT